MTLIESAFDVILNISVNIKFTIKTTFYYNIIITCILVDLNLLFLEYAVALTSAVINSRSHLIDSLLSVWFVKCDMAS